MIEPWRRDILMRLRGIERENFRKAAGHRDSTMREANQKEFWSSHERMELGLKNKCHIAYAVADFCRPVSRSKFGKLAVSQHDTPIAEPKTEKGNSFQSTTYASFLSGEIRVVPQGYDRQLCMEAILKAADAYLRPKNEPHYLKQGASLFSKLVDFEGTREEAIGACLDLISPDAPIDFSRGVEAAVLGDLHAESVTLPLWVPRERYSEFESAMLTHRTIEITGPDYAGKKSLIRKFISKYRSRGFETSGGSRLPICALSLHNVTPNEAIEHIANFYHRVCGTSHSGNGIRDLLAEIDTLVKEIPAVILMADVDALDGDEIVRALNQDFIGDLIIRLRHGHPETRIVISSSSHALDALISQSDYQSRRLQFDRTIAVSNAKLGPWAYHHAALKRAAAALAGENDAIGAAHHEVGEETCEQDVRDLATAICASTLDEAELRCLALVGMSQDGLEEHTLERICNALATDKASVWNMDIRRILDGLPEQIVRKPIRKNRAARRRDARRLADGGTYRANRIDKRALGFAGSYHLERSIRPYLIRHWASTRPDEFRQGCWGIARAANEVAYRLRLHAGPEVSAGRDVQVLLFLLASIDVLTCQNPDTPIGKEHAIVPPLSDDKTPMPDAGKALAFAFTNLFEDDFCETTGRSNGVLTDARLRLAVAHAFIDNSRTWQPYRSRRHENWILAEDRSPLLKLPLSHQLSLLEFATSAAARMSSNAVISNCVHMAESLTRWSDEGGAPDELELSVLKQLSRIQRTELEFGILLGQNPENLDGVIGSSSDETSMLDMTIVATRVDELMGRLPGAEEDAKQRLDTRNSAIDRLRMELAARKAEILHLQGKGAEARELFLNCLGLAADSTDPTGARNVGGRNRRMYVKLLIDLERSHAMTSGLTIEGFNQAPGALPGFPAVVFNTMLPVPLIPIQLASSNYLDEAESLLREAGRRASLGTVNDWIGAKIDRIRLDTFRHDYSSALHLLDHALTLVTRPGVNRDVTLELLSVETRTLVDAAAFALAMSVYNFASSELKRRSNEEIRSLANRFDIDAENLEFWQTCTEISAKLCQQAKWKLDRLRSYGSIRSTPLQAQAADQAANEQTVGVPTRFSIYADYLDVWLNVLQSRQYFPDGSPEHEAPDVRRHLETAGEKLGNVIERMIASNYLLLVEEATRLADCLAMEGIRVEQASWLRAHPAA